jgi:hypothetical protein
MFYCDNVKHKYIKQLNQFNLPVQSGSALLPLFAFSLCVRDNESGATNYPSYGSHI